jgi:hypothetical protein
MIINQITHKDMKNYPTNLTENQWQVIENILNDTRKMQLMLVFLFLLYQFNNKSLQSAILQCF